MVYEKNAQTTMTHFYTAYNVPEKESSPTEYISDRPKQALLIEISFLVCLLFKAGYVTE